MHREVGISIGNKVEPPWLFSRTRSGVISGWCIVWPIPGVIVGTVSRFSDLTVVILSLREYEFTCEENGDLHANSWASR